MDSERAVLGGVMMLGEARNEYYDNVINSRFALSASHFVSEGHKSIWRAIDYCNANNPAGNWDVREVYQEMLKKRMIAREGEKPTAGQIPDDYLADLTQIAGAAVNMMPYAKLIVEAWEWRVTGDAFSRAAGLFKPSGDSWDESASVTEVSDKAHAMLLRADEKIRRGYVDDVRSGGELAKEMFDEVTEAINNDGINKKFRGLYTSIWQLDNETSGLMPGEMTVLGARPNVGKTALGLWIALRTLVNQRFVNEENEEENAPLRPVYFVSAEMSPKQIMARILAQQARINSRFYRNPKIIRDNGLTELSSGVENISKFPLFIDGGKNLSMDEIRVRASRIHRRFLRPDFGGVGLGLVVVDYIQLLRGDGDKFGGNRFFNPVEEIANITRGLKLLAEDLDMPVLALSQLNRESDKRATQTQLLSDLRGSGAIEQDADVVVFMNENSKEKRADGKKILELSLLKNRHGEKELKWDMIFDPAFNTFLPWMANMPAENWKSNVWSLGQKPPPGALPAEETVEDNADEGEVSPGDF